MTTRLPGMNTYRVLTLAALLGWAAPVPQLAADERDDEIARLRQELQQTREKLESARDRVEQLEEKIAAMGGSAADIGDVADPMAGQEDGLQPWTESMRRSPMHVLFPGAATIPKHDYYGRFTHISRESMNNKLGSGEQTEPFHNLLGLEDNVRVGMLLGYGISDRWDAWVQRTNGRTMIKDMSGDSASFDYWDLMTKYHLLDEYEDGMDLSVYGGITYMMEDNEAGNTSLNAGFTVERSFLGDRLRLSTGLLFASLSAYEETGAAVDVAPTKQMPGELDDPYMATGPDYTLSIPVGLSLALTSHWQLFAEGIFPVSGYDTGKAPTLAYGGRYVTNTHEFALFFTNTSNNSFNALLTGGYCTKRVDQFGFSISIFY